MTAVAMPFETSALAAMNTLSMLGTPSPAMWRNPPFLNCDAASGSHCDQRSASAHPQFDIVSFILWYLLGMYDARKASLICLFSVGSFSFTVCVSGYMLVWE
jgi:hypothetical protein